MLSHFDVDKIGTEALLFQTGYLTIAVEEPTSHGRLDLAVRAAGHVYLVEFRVAEMAPPGSALAQLRERRYADKYRATGDQARSSGRSVRHPGAGQPVSRPRRADEQ